MKIEFDLTKDQLLFLNYLVYSTHCKLTYEYNKLLALKNKTLEESQLNKYQIQLNDIETSLCNSKIILDELNKYKFD